MKHVNLGASGLKVSRLCLGTMMFGGPTDEAESLRIIATAKDQGVNFIDSADVYSAGRSEEVVGKAMANDRDRWVVATKLANRMADDPNGMGLSRKWVFRAVDGSLKRLRTDYIDVCYLHKEDHGTPLVETVRAIADLVRAGKIRHFGVSNYRAWRIAEICRLTDDAGIDRPVVSQPYYHALYRTAEVEVLPACRAFGIGVFSYSPLARGVLTGKYSPDTAPAAGTRAARGDQRLMQTEWHPQNLAAAQQIKAHAEARGVGAAHFAIAWVLANRCITGIVAGPRTAAQWDDYVKALDVRLSADDEAFVNGLVPAGHPAVAGYTDPQYPIEGRDVAKGE